MKPSQLRITGERVRLLPFGRAHAKQLWKSVGNSPDMWRYRRPEAIPRSKREWNRSVRKARKERIQLAVEDLTGELIGTISLFNLTEKHEKVQVGYLMILPPYMGKGYSQEVFKVLLTYCFRELGLYRVEMQIATHNHRAIRVIEKLGCTFEGVLRGAKKHGQRHVDIAVYSYLADEW